jgi:hypothetical protein
VLNTVTESTPQKVELTGVRVGKKSKKFALISIILLLVAASSVFAVWLINEHKYKLSYDSYIDTLEAFRWKSLISASQSEELCKLTGRVWRNAIYEESDPTTDEYTKDGYLFVDDFNIALMLLYIDPDTQETVSDIEDSKEGIREMWRGLQEPPEGLEKCYDVAGQLYEAYNGLSGLAIDPTGNLTSFSENTQGYIDSTMKYYEQLSDIIPEKFFEDDTIQTESEEDPSN